MKTYVVTGVAGFIGSSTALALLRRGARVVGIDNLNDYYDPARKESNLAELRDEARDDTFRFVRGDIRDTKALRDVFSTPCDAVIHLAAMAGVRASMDDPELYYDVNLNGTLKLLTAIQDAGQPHFVLASTSSVYGNTEVRPFVETDKADRPLAPYPASKRAAEMLGHSFHHLYQQTFTALRFFTVYGPRGRPDMMAYKVLENIFHGEVVPLYNDGKMYRDWTYVDDIVAGILAAADKPQGYQVINLGKGEPTLLSDFVRMIEDLAGKPSSLTNQPMMAADVEYTYADISLAQERLGYRPQVSVSEGVRAFWEWYKLTVLKR